MEKVIQRGKIVANNWQKLDSAEWLRVGESGLLVDFPAGVALLAPLDLWRLRGDDLLAHRGPVGVHLEPADDPAEIAASVGKFDLIAVNFPHFTDGRGYSTARLLRERYGYRGELRAVGDVLRDQIHYLYRCGFDAFALRADQDAAAALGAFADFTEAYQASVDCPQPLFRRRVVPLLRRAAGV